MASKEEVNVFVLRGTRQRFKRGRLPEISKNTRENFSKKSTLINELIKRSMLKQ